MLHKDTWRPGRSCRRRGHRPRTRPPAEPDRADRLGKHRLGRCAARAGLGADQQVCRRLSRQALLWRLRVCRRGRDASPSSAPRNCSAPASPTSSRIPAPRPTRPCSSRCCSPATASWACRSPMAATSRTARPSPCRASGSTSSATRSVRTDQLIDYDQMRALALETRPKLIVAGASAYPRAIDFAAFRADRRRGGRLSDGRYGPLCRPRRRRRLSRPDAARPCRHDHHAQDPARSARRHDPHQ